MNKERILALADLIEQQPHTTREDKLGFSMESYVHDCGTPSCIAGWASWLSRKKPRAMTEGSDIFDRGAKYLGLDNAQSFRLFMPEGYHYASDYPPSQAAATLRHLAKTGEVDWSATTPRHSNDEE